MVGNLISAFDFENPNYGWPRLPHTRGYVVEGGFQCKNLPPPLPPLLATTTAACCYYYYYYYYCCYRVSLRSAWELTEFSGDASQCESVDVSMVPGILIGQYIIILYEYDPTINSNGPTVYLVLVWHTCWYLV
jgi:hypothetical protein